MYDARDIANQIIDLSIEKGPKITSLQLLKILYFAHAWHLAKYNKPLVAQKFEAWQYGPVCNVIYKQISKQKDLPIDYYLRKLNVDTGEYEYIPPIIDENTKIFIQNIFRYYSNYSGFYLSDLTHANGSPWDTIWHRADKSAQIGMVIPNTLIRSWFMDSGMLLLYDNSRRNPS